MSIELMLLSWALVLALVQIALPALGRGFKFGIGWALGPRDTETPPQGLVIGRLDRARQNLFETLPIFAAAVIILALMGHSNAMTVLATQIYLGARIAYVFAYAAGIPGIRSLIWGASLVAILMLLRQILTF